MQPKPSTEDLLTVREVAAILRMTEAEIRIRINRGLIHAYKPKRSRAWLVPRSAVDAYIVGDRVAGVA